ncbi:hypothetical protein MBAV_004866 [Candidatus Magnetobacterium bavaricum]|uniref:Uncharacterized protein n=1 Tax=Candidatus Magnetobacterium bavaricum TaxID=29290 RepID=A0A0F3GM93_9BACT|nr:hypothetical protein MBAV_004866 [Candidatus Magnetobacterium bavaricum]
METTTTKNKGTYVETLPELSERVDSIEEILSMLKYYVGLALIDLAIKYRAQGNDAEAMECVNRSIIIEPECLSGSYALMGDLFAVQNNTAEAISSYTMALEIDANTDHVYLKRGREYLKTGHYNEALADCTSEIRRYKDSAESYFLRAETQEMLNNINAAIGDYVVAARLGHEDAQDYLQSRGITWGAGSIVTDQVD